MLAGGEGLGGQGGGRGGGLSGGGGGGGGGGRGGGAAGGVVGAGGGRAYVQAALDATRRWLAGVPEGEPVAVLFSGGVDSGSVFLLARQALRDLGRDPDRVRAFTLDMGGGHDAAQAERWVREMGLED